MDVVKKIVRYNLHNPRVLKYMKDEHISSAQLKERVISQYKTTMTSDHILIQKLRDFVRDKKKPPEIPYHIFIDLYNSDMRLIIDSYIHDDFFRQSMYFVNFLTHIFYKDRVFETFIMKKGKNHVYLCFFETGELKYLLEFLL